MATLSLADLQQRALQGINPSSGNDVVASSGNVAATATTATIPAAAGLTNYITGFIVTGAGATAASVIQVTVTGCIGGTMTFDMAIPAGVAVAVQPLSITFPRPVAATGVAVAIVVNVPSFGAGNTSAAVVAFGVRA
jgi:hypothetical protein